MVSFAAAASLGAQGIELDVQLAKDGTIVVIHDETVNRTTNGKGAVRTYTYDELAKLDASYKFGKQVGFCPIPMLEQVLRWLCTNSLFINIELKNNKVPYHGLEEEVVTLIRKYEMEQRTILSSFNHYSMAKCHQMASDIETALLYKEGLHSPWAYAKKIGAKSIHPNYKYISNAVIELTLANGVEVRPYTVNNEDVMRELMSLGVSAIITDYPEAARQVQNMYK